MIKEVGAVVEIQFFDTGLAHGLDPFVDRLTELFHSVLQDIK